MPLKKELKTKLATAKQEQKAKIEELKALIQTQKQKIVEKLKKKLSATKSAQMRHGNSPEIRQQGPAATGAVVVAKWLE